MLNVDQIKAIAEQRTGQKVVCYGGGSTTFTDGTEEETPIVLEVCAVAAKFPALLGLDVIEEMQQRINELEGALRPFANLQPFHGETEGVEDFLIDIANIMAARTALGEGSQRDGE